MPTTLRQRRKAVSVGSTVAVTRPPQGRGPLALIGREVSARRARRRINGALVASGVKIGGEIKAEQIKRLRQPWQHRALLYYDLIPEIKYAGQFYSRHMSKIEVRVERYDPATDEWTPAPNTPASDFLDRIQDPGGGRSGLFGTYGRLRFLTGESYLVCFAPDTGDERWETLSADEFQPKEDGKTFTRKKGENAVAEEWRLAGPMGQFTSPEDRAKTCTAWRLWRRHPRYSSQADSAMQACMDICEELLLLTLAVRAQARSRIARSGILKVPSEISPPPPEPRPGEDPIEDPLLRTLALHMEAPLVDEGSPAALVPMFIRGPSAFLKELQQLELNVTGANYPEVALRVEAISRLANGLDMPREALLGTADVNHWGAWQIDQQTWDAHVQPVVEEMCDELTSAILRPTLEDNDMTRAESRLYRVWYDPVKITNHPDRGKDAVDAYDRGELGGAALRQALGFDESDAPNLAELARYIGIRVRDAGLAWYGVPTLKTTGAQPEAPPPNEGDPGIQDPNAETPPQDGGTGNDATTGPPVAADQASLLFAAEVALHNCRRMAGNRIVSKSSRDTALRKMPRSEVYARMDRDNILSGALSSAIDLVSGGTEPLRHTLNERGYPPERIQAICKLIERHAADTLHEENPRALPVIILNL